jgi:choline-sulfatase
MPWIRQLLCVVSLAANAFAAVAAPPNIILITVDTTRADRMGFLGSDRGLTPNLDVLARQSIVFTHAYSQAPLTAPSHATILTGTYPQFHQVQDFETPLSKDLPFAPAILKAHGYHTAAFIGAMVLDPSLALGVGFDRGFDTYDAGFHQPVPGEDRYSSAERRGGVVVEHALAWLSKHPGGPFFIWVHLYDPHHPYDPPEPFKTQYKLAPYDGEIAYTDSVVGKFLSQLRACGLYDGTLIAVMGDHGEALGDHGEDFHGFFLYDETIRVPLLFKLPQEQFAAKRVENHVGLIDVLPTILQIASIEIPKEMQGQSLRSMMTLPPGMSAGTGPASAVERSIYSETEYGRRAYGWSAVRSLRAGKYLFVEVPRRELYDQTADPKEERDLAAASKAVADTLQGQLDTFRQQTSSSAAAPKLATDPQAQEKLAALGYMSASHVSVDGVAMGIGADPKDKVQVGNMIAQANFLLEDARFDEGAKLLQQIIVKEPNMPIVYAKLGMAEFTLGHMSEAVKAMRRAVELLPDSTDLHFNLGRILLQSKDYEAAIPELEGVVAKMPGSWQSHILLEIAYARTNRLPQAIKECKTVLDVLPEQYGTNLILGRVLIRSGDPEAALPRLKKAAEIRPQAPEPHMSLVEAYDKLGQTADADRERSEATSLLQNGPGVNRPPMNGSPMVSPPQN